MNCVYHRNMETPKKNCEVCGSLFFNLRYNAKGQRIRKYTKEKWAEARFCSFSCRNQVVKNRLGKVRIEVTYSGIHRWVNHHLGKHPKKCAHCGVDGKKNGRNWSIHYANVSGLYSRDKKDWVPLCTCCHRRFDKKID